MGKFPSFFNPDTVGTRYSPDLAKALAEGADAGLPPASRDKRKVLLLLIDLQTDFVLQDGRLAVKGAVKSLATLLRFLYEHAEEISSIMCSLDKHIPFQIFFDAWWIGKTGKRPDPYTSITLDAVRKGEWIPRLEKAESLAYVEHLEKTGQVPLMIWPAHCFIGTDGSALMAALSEAIAWHARARHAQPMYIFKGTVPTSEHYGIIEPCRIIPNHPQGGVNTDVLNAINSHDLVLMAGEAEDFCVRNSMEQIMMHFGTKPDVLKRVVFLRNCTDLVFPDKRTDADNFLDQMSSRGIRIATTQTAL